MDSRVDESCTFNIKVLPNAEATHRGDDNGVLPLECDVSIGQSSHERLAVIINAVDEIKVRTNRDGRVSHSEFKSLLFFFKNCDKHEDLASNSDKNL